MACVTASPIAQVLAVLTASLGWMGTTPAAMTAKSASSPYGDRLCESAAMKMMAAALRVR